MTRHALHIGTHKTGTTFIQAFLAQNRNALLQQSVRVPIFDGGKSWLFGRKMSPKDHAFLPSQFKSDSSRINRIAEQIKKSKADYSVVKLKI